MVEIEAYFGQGQVSIDFSICVRVSREFTWLLVLEVVRSNHVKNCWNQGDETLIFSGQNRQNE